jgi:uncharacterized coiled-coil protein SlyX
MDWTILGSIVSIALIASATVIKISGTGKRETCMEKFTQLEKEQALQKQKFETIEAQLADIRETIHAMSLKIDKLFFVIPKRSRIDIQE